MAFSRVILALNRYVNLRVRSSTLSSPSEITLKKWKSESGYFSSPMHVCTVWGAVASNFYGHNMGLASRIEFRWLRWKLAGITRFRAPSGSRLA